MKKIYDDGKIFGIGIFIPRATSAKRKEFINKNYANVISVCEFVIMFVSVLCIVIQYKIQYNMDIFKIIFGILLLAYCYLIHYINIKYNEQAEEGFKV